MTELNDEIIDDDMYLIHNAHVLSPSKKVITRNQMATIGYTHTIEDTWMMIQALVDELNRLHRRNRHLQFMMDEETMG